MLPVNNSEQAENSVGRTERFLQGSFRTLNSSLSRIFIQANVFGRGKTEMSFLYSVYRYIGQSFKSDDYRDVESVTRENFAKTFLSIYPRRREENRNVWRLLRVLINPRLILSARPEILEGLTS